MSLLWPQQEAPSLQQAAPSLQQSPFAEAFLAWCPQQPAPSLQHLAPSLQKEAFGWLSPSVSAGATELAVCAHMLRAKRRVTKRVLNFMMIPHFALSLARRSLHWLMRAGAKEV